MTTRACFGLVVASGEIRAAKTVVLLQYDSLHLMPEESA
jgi:hypothetical protein